MMRKRSFALWVTVSAVIASSEPTAAETHVILARPNFRWSYNGQSSQVVTVGDLKIGDVVDVQIPGGRHGFSTIRKNPPPITPIENLVLKCGEAESAKPERMLREIECGSDGSKFGKHYVGSMKLEVLDTFKGEVPFWCIEHQEMMQGVLKLQAPGASADKPRASKAK